MSMRTCGGTALATISAQFLSDSIEKTSALLLPSHTVDAPEPHSRTRASGVEAKNSLTFLPDASVHHGVSRV